MTFVGGISASSNNILGYSLTTMYNSDVVRVGIEISFSRFSHRSSVATVFEERPQSIDFAKQIQKYLAQFLGDVAKPIQLRELYDIINQDWAKAYNPLRYYIPSVNVSSIVRPHAFKDELPDEVIIAVSQELDTHIEQAKVFANIVKLQIRQGEV
jgi:hypothetical protein